MSALELPSTPPWMADAACHGMPTSYFFPSVGRGGEIKSEARSICEACPVKDECLEFALGFPAHFDMYGIFGGTTANQRRKLRSERQAGTAPEQNYDDVFADLGTDVDLQDLL